MIRSSSNLACLSNYSTKANKPSSLRKESSRAARVLLSSSRCEHDTIVEEETGQRRSKIDEDRDLDSLYPTLEATFDSMSTLQLSRTASNQFQECSPNEVVPHPTSFDNSLNEKEQHFSILCHLFYIFIVYYVDCIVERVAFALRRNIHRAPFLLKLECVKTLVKPSNGNFGATHSLHRTQNLIEAISSGSDETLSPAMVVKTSSFLDPSEEWGHFAHFQE